MRRGPTCALLAAAVTVVLAACGTSGRALEPPAPGATAPPRASVTTPTDEPRVPSTTTTFALSTEAWAPGSSIGRAHTCDGDDVSPQLAISNTPPGTTELALVATGSGDVSWVVAGIPPDITQIAQGTVPPGAVVGANSAGVVGWTDPCPPEGGGPRLFDITLYALGSPSGATEGMPTTEAVALVTDPARVIATSVLTGTVSR